MSTMSPDQRPSPPHPPPPLPPPPPPSPLLMSSDEFWLLPSRLPPLTNLVYGNCLFSGSSSSFPAASSHALKVLKSALSVNNVVRTHSSPYFILSLDAHHTPPLSSSSFVCSSFSSSSFSSSSCSSSSVSTISSSSFPSSRYVPTPSPRLAASFFPFYALFGQQAQKGRCPIEQRGKFPSVRMFERTSQRMSERPSHPPRVQAPPDLSPSAPSRPQPPRPLETIPKPQPPCSRPPTTPPSQSPSPL